MPNGGGYSLQFYDINPTKFGQFDNFITFSENYGKQIYHFNGIDLNVNARFPFALTLQGGFSTGNMTEDECQVGAETAGDLHSARQRRYALGRPIDRPMVPGAIAIVSLDISRTSRDWPRPPIPKVDVLISGTIQSKPVPWGRIFPVSRPRASPHMRLRRTP